jgi:ferritin-like metal-binding protein YciE
MKTLSDAFEHTLQDVYYAENAISKALPNVIEAVSQADLKKALQHHLGETKEHISILKKVFKSAGLEVKGEKCDAIEGLIKECDGVIKEAKGATAKHAAIIGCCQAIEHYEIARYGTLREWAKAIDQPDAHDMLSAILDQEKAANHKLTNLAVSTINKA